MIIENGLTLTGIEHNICLLLTEFLAKLSVDKLDVIHIHLIVDRLEHILEVKTF
jgi:hypothetical protein